MDSSFNSKKFKQVLEYIISKTSCLPNVGKTVIWKILYFVDFDFYELYEQNFTGENYFKLEHGPAPKHFDQIIDELIVEGKVKVIETSYGQYTQTRYIPLIEPDLSLLNGNELQYLENEIVKYSHLNATQISDTSHKDMPYRATEDMKEIDYELVFYRESLTSVREYLDD